METETKFLRRRAQQEREAAMKAGDPQVRRVHQDLAKRYEEALDKPR